MPRLDRPLAASLIFALSLVGCRADAPAAGPHLVAPAGPNVVVPALAAPAPRAGSAPAPTARPEAVLGQAVRVAETPLLPDADQLAPVERPLEPIARARSSLSSAASLFEQGRFAAVLDLLDASPAPADAADVVASWRAESYRRLGRVESARAALAGPALTGTTNRVVLVRAATTADALAEWGLAGDFWARAAQQPAWWAETSEARRQAAGSYTRAGLATPAAEQIVALADRGGRTADLVAGLRALPVGGGYGAAVVLQALGSRVEAAQAYRRYLAANPNGAQAVDAQERLSALERLRPRDDSKSFEAAVDVDTADAYRGWMAANPSSPRVPEARFREGLAEYRDGDYAAALATWRASPESGGHEARARSLYWIAKALIQLDQNEAAGAAWRQAAAIRPSSYYSVRAADRLAGSGTAWPTAAAGLPAAAPSADEEAELERWIVSWSSAPTTLSEQEAAALRRGALFAGAGMERTALAELDGLSAASRNPRVVYQAGKAAVDAQLWSSAVTAGIRLSRMAPETSVLDMPAAVKRLALPAGYGERVQRETSQRGLPPVLLLSLIRQESLFDRFAHSSADARGLTQVIPPTGRELASALGRPSFSPEELFDPDLAVTFGARYLAGQIKYFDGDVFRAVAAYNAGAGAAGRWARGADPDVFVEAIPYAETREYVRAIYQFYAGYRSLLGS